MSDDEKDSEDEEEGFVFDVSEKPDLSKYDGIKGF